MFYTWVVNTSLIDKLASGIEIVSLSSMYIMIIKISHEKIPITYQK